MNKIILLVALFLCGPGVPQSTQDIIEAVKKGDMAVLRQLLDGNPKLVDEADRYTLRPLHWAALTGQRQAAELLLARGADINRKTRLARTPFNIAVQHNHRDLAELLREKGADPGPWIWPRITGDYLGESPPGPAPRLFAPEILSSIVFDHAAPAFTRDGNEVFWAVVFENETGVLMGMRRDGDAWAELKPLPFSEARFRDICPTLSADGTKLYFTSSRPVRKGGNPDGFNMWVVDRTASGWSEPRPLAPEIGSNKDARPVFSGDGTMYFGSGREGTVDGTNIFRSRRIDGKFETPQRLDAGFNTSNAMPAYISPDERVLLFESFRPGGLGGSDFWRSLRRSDGTWGPAANLGDPVNSKANDWFGGFSPDGKYFFFVSDRDGNNDVYWIDARVIDVVRTRSLK
jgi:hypothetical protein